MFIGKKCSFFWDCLGSRSKVGDLSPKNIFGNKTTAGTKTDLNTQLIFGDGFEAKGSDPTQATVDG